MYFRTNHGSLELIKGSPVQVAFEICFFAWEDEVRRYQALSPEERVADDLKRIEMEIGSVEIQYDEATTESHRRIAKELGLPESTEWWDVQLENVEYLAKKLEMPFCQDLQHLNRVAINFCAVELGLPVNAEWRKVIQAFNARKDEIFARFNYEFSA